MDIARQIEAAIEEYLAESNPQHPYLRRFVARLYLLPLLVDWNGFFGIRPNGDILCVLHDDGSDATEVVKDNRTRRVALARGAKKYPWLAAVIPTRSKTAVDCSSCNGTGQINVEGPAPDTIICDCGGLGWLEAAEQAALKNN